MPSDNPKLKRLGTKHLQPFSTYHWIIFAQAVLVTMMVSMDLFTTSYVVWWYRGMLWSALALGCKTFYSPLDLCSGITWADGITPDLDNELRMVNFWHVSSSGAITPAGLSQCRSGASAMTVSVRHHFFASETHEHVNDLPRCTWARTRTLCWWSKVSSLMLDDTAESVVSPLRSSPMCWFVCFFCIPNQVGGVRHPEWAAQRQIIGRKRFRGQQRLAALLNASALSRCASWSFSKSWFITSLGIGSICCNDDRKLGYMEESV